MGDIFSGLIGFVMSTMEYIQRYHRSGVRLYIPIFFSLRFLRLQDIEGQQRIIKYWCLYSILFVVDLLLKPLINEVVYPILLVVLFSALNYDKYVYTEAIYDKMISPLFDRYKENIEQLAQQVEQIFKQKTQTLQKGVKESFESKAKKVMGNILVQVMNPNAGQ